MNGPAGGARPAVFTQGSVFRHVMVMTLTSAVGLKAIFLIDLLSMFYVSLAHRDAWRAAVSLMAKVMFFPFAVNLGMMAAIGTVVSVAIGRGDLPHARRLASTGLVLIGLLGLVVSFGALPWRVDILRLFGAEGEALEAAARLLALTMPVGVLLSVGMGCAAVLRAYGDARRAMFVTLAGAVATSIADPIFIFGFGQGVDGVGMAIVVSRIVFVAVGLWGAVRVHRLVAAPRWRAGVAAVRPIAMIALPAVATNLALPFADWYVTRTIWQFGVAASAAAGVFDRIMPFAFSLVLALATAIGPIAGQNLGAGNARRVRQTFLHALAITVVYGAAVWLVISAVAPGLAALFSLAAGTETFFRFLCRYATITWIFVGLMLVANTMFNTLGRAPLATAFNWGRATLGTIPFVWLGARSGGAEVAMIGITVAAMIFAGLSLAVADRLTRRLDRSVSALALSLETGLPPPA